MRNEFGTCIVCGGECPCCTSTTGWRRVACSIEHYELFLVLREYQAGRMSAQEALERVEELRAEHGSPLIPAVEAVLDRMAAEASIANATSDPLEEEPAQESETPQSSTRFRAKRRTKEAHG